MNLASIPPERKRRLRTNNRHKHHSMPPSPIMLSAPQPLPEMLLEDEVGSLRREKLDLYAQLFEAAQIQRKLSGPRESRHGCLQFASEIFAARFLSGDFTTFMQNGSADHPKILAVHGDIAGKGVPAGMWFTNLAGVLQSHSRPDVDLTKIAMAINRQLFHLRPVAPFVTAFLAQVDCLFGELTYCNAGHFPPILLRASGRTSLLETGGPLLGALEDAEFRAGELTLEPGDTLVAYSDGVLECHNASGEEFGLDRILESIRLIDPLSAQSTLMTVLAALQDFANGSPLSDDVSLTVIQRDTPAPRSSG